MNRLKSKLAFFSGKVNNPNSEEQLFESEFQKLLSQEKEVNKRFDLLWEDKYPILDEKDVITGFDRHYVYHTAWAARILQTINPTLHIDISSFLYFSTIVSSFIPIKFYDFHKVNLELNNLEVNQANLYQLPFKDDSISSLSCMHVVEHIGLGRYGDKIDYEGDLIAINELKRVLSKDGNLLFVVPLGAKAKILFNAHRIYTFKQIEEYFSGLNLEEFTLIPENENDGHLVINPSKELIDKQNYGCGCFWFKKE